MWPECATALPKGYSLGSGIKEPGRAQTQSSGLWGLHMVKCPSFSGASTRRCQLHPLSTIKDSSSCAEEKGRTKVTLSPSFGVTWPAPLLTEACVCETADDPWEFFVPPKQGPPHEIPWEHLRHSKGHFGIECFNLKKKQS